MFRRKVESAVVGTLLAEAFLFVFAIVLGLWINSLWQRRTSFNDAQRALHVIVDEIAQNQGRLRTLIPHLQGCALTSLPIANALSDAAWRVSQRADLGEHLGYEKAIQLARTYDLQTRFLEIEEQLTTLEPGATAANQCRAALAIATALTSAYQGTLAMEKG